MSPPVLVMPRLHRDSSLASSFTSSASNNTYGCLLHTGPKACLRVGLRILYYFNISNLLSSLA